MRPNSQGETMKFSKYATLVAVLGFACAYTVVGCGGGGGGDASGGKGGKGGTAGSKSGGSGGAKSGGSGGSKSGGSGGTAPSGSGGVTGTGGVVGSGGTVGTGGAAPVTGGAGGGTPPAGGLIGYWPFDGDAKDKSGKGNDGTVVKGGTEAAPAATGTYEAGKKGMALKFNNPTQAADPTWVKVPRSDSIDSTGTSGAFSITLWANVGAIDAMKFNFCLSRHEVGTAFEHFGLGISGGKPTVAVHFFFASAADALTPGTWTHLAGIYDGITATIYVNGTLSSSLDVGWPIAADTTNLVIAGNQNIDVVKEAWDGSLDEVRLYSSAIAAADVMADMTK
jgi:hypothetical protein